MSDINLVTIKTPKSPVSEAYRILRTNIQFSSFDNKIKTIVVTSSGPSEGKTTTVCNLGISMAEAQYKTIIVDCDQRKPKVHRIFEISNEKGLSDLLIDEVSIEDVLNKTSVDNLYVLPSGTRPPNPSELLASTKMHQFLDYLKENFDYIVLDAPPIIMVTDAQILSQYSDGCLLVIASGEADKEAAIKAKKLLENVNAKIIGVVLNKLERPGRGYYQYYYHYYYGSDNKKVKVKKKGRMFSLFKRKNSYLAH